MKSYTKNPKSAEEMRTDKWVMMKEIENRRDRLVKRNKRPEFVSLLNEALEVLNVSEGVVYEDMLVDENDFLNLIKKYK